MHAIHLICRRSDGVSLDGVTFVKGTTSFRSGQWDLAREDAERVVGGWLYLHSAKGSRAEIGGVVESFEEVTDPTLAHSRRIVFLVAAKKEARGQRWRGQAHHMAHCGGPVIADLPHELAGRTQIEHCPRQRNGATTA